MTTSMTGYGQGQAQSGSLKLTVELNSVNRKQLE
ncbi:MAG: YicC/YloC family endoribonuclease, partial [Limisphaerales bacterium]